MPENIYAGKCKDVSSHEMPVPWKVLRLKGSGVGHPVQKLAVPQLGLPARGKKKNVATKGLQVLAHLQKD